MKYVLELRLNRGTRLVQVPFEEVQHADVLENIQYPTLSELAQMGCPPEKQVMIQKLKAIAREVVPHPDPLAFVIRLYRLEDQKLAAICDFDTYAGFLPTRIGETTWEPRQPYYDAGMVGWGGLQELLRG